MPSSINKTISEFIQTISSIFGKGEAESIARIIFEDVFAITNWQKKGEFTEDQSAQLKKIESRLLKNEPIQYILGQADFYGYKFEVSPAVLIPRQETEELVHWVLQDLPPNAKIIDIGTGSGCIPLSIKLKRQDIDVFACDISESALELAQKNASKYNLDVNFIHLDITQRQNWQPLSQFDVIISNPPYIPKKEEQLMPNWVLQYEPHLALFVENNNPLFFYDCIADFALKKGTHSAKLFFETNEYNASNVVKLLEEKGFVHIELKKDLNDKDRMIKAICPNTI